MWRKDQEGGRRSRCSALALGDGSPGIHAHTEVPGAELLLSEPLCFT